MNSKLAKDAVGKAAADLIQSDMLIGLGTGSTASFFISHLIERCRNGLKITAVATSERSKQQALAGGIRFADINEVISIDMTVDGADEIDLHKRMIKGGGGALLREKIIASISTEMVVIVDEFKVVKTLGTVPLPVEIVPFAYKAIIHEIKSLGFSGVLRTDHDNPYLTDNGHYIFDIHFQGKKMDPEKVQKRIAAIPGVLETGFFFDLAGRVLIGKENGEVKQF